ncbi:MAG: flagellin [Burkholderiales bacterium]|nr:flagellin [Burkholderiales bacterium]
MSVINTNVKALVAQESMRSSNLSMSQAMERLSTGSKINSAKDDAAGLAITNRMTSQIRGMAKAIGNVNDAISMSQTAEGAIGNIGDILQRMRELAVQSGTGTMNNSDRSSIQLEVAQLKTQIDDIAKKTNHNNIKLLDGTAQNVVIQTGTNSDETMKIGFDSMQAKDIGMGSRASLSSIGGLATTRVALVENQLLLNGIAVGASVAVDDPATAAATSSIAKAAAINKVANLSGVYAKADATIVSGSIMTGTANSVGTITINGVVSDGFTTTTDTSVSRKNAAAAINAKSSQTGVVAIDTGDDNTGVQLVAKDGRNITVAFTTATAASSGVAAAETYTGSINLFTLDGRDINVNTNSGASTALAASGLRAGTYKSDVAQTISAARTVANIAPTSADQGFLYGNSMIINDVAIGAALVTDDTASDTTALGSTRSSSAIAIAAAINRSSAKTGVTASAQPNIVRGTGFSATVTASTMTLNNISITVNSSSRDGVIDSINDQTGKTGVVASAWGDGIQLTAADGRNIAVSTTTTVANLGLTGIVSAATAASATTFISQVQLSASNAFTMRAGSHGVPNLEALGFKEGTFGGSDNGLKVNQLDVSTVAGSTQAIMAIDAAINTVSAAQAKSGAINNRLDSIINNLTEGSKNMQASRSRILDTDYATETTNLAKQQIIQQAATAMLAQANQSSQSILSLLK